MAESQREGYDMYRFVCATHVLLNSSLDMSVYLINVYIYICMKDDLQLGKLRIGTFRGLLSDSLPSESW